MAKFNVIFDADVCKGCELCMSFCPKKLIHASTRINNKGYSPAAIAQPEECVGCASCALVCPDGAITILKEEVPA